MPDPLSDHPDLKYGVASRYQFDDPQKWVTVPGVPLLDEHEMVGDNGKVVATVDRKVLEEIASNNNRRVRETGDPATLILGHTSDDPRAAEKPAQGFVVNYRVRPFKRDERGQVVYAIHGDYKLRPKNAGLIEKYPRRSVELWWHKKELDPIALLGGSAPERDLSVVIKNARLNHVTMNHAPAPSTTRNGRGHVAPVPDSAIRFHRRGPATIENYRIDDALSLKDRLHRYEARFNTQGDDDMNCDPRGGGSMDYSDDQFGDDDGGMDTRDLHDPGDSDVPDDSGTGGDGDLDGLDDGSGDGDMGGAGESDPTLAKVFQSKQFRGMASKIDTMMQMLSELTSALGGGAGGGQPPMPGGDEQGNAEMPPPGAGGGPMDAPGGDEGMDAEGGDDGTGAEEHESMRGMGKKPVQMGSTAFPGSADVAIPQFAGGSSRNGKHRSGPSKMSRKQIPTRGAPVATQQRGRTPASQGDPEKVRMQRQIHDLSLKYAQSKAEERINALLAEGILFGRDQKEHDEGVAETKAYFTGLLASGGQGADADITHEEGIIRTRYARRKPNPAQPTAPGLARYARDPVPREGAPVEGEDSNDFTPQDPEQASEFADLQAVHKMSRLDAVKYMRKKLAR